MRGRCDVLLVGPRSDGPLLGGIETGIDMLLRSSLVERHAVQYFNSYRAPDTGRSWLARVAYQLGAFGRFASQLVMSRPGIVHVKVADGVNFVQGIGYGLIARALGCRVLLQIHGGEFDSWYERVSAPARTALRLALRVPTALVVLSEYWRAYIAALRPGRPIHVVPNGVETARAGVGGQRYGSTLRVLTVGAIGVRKGHFDIIEAAALLRDEPVVFEFVGPDEFGGETEQLRRQAEAAGVSSLVRFLGPLSGAAKWSAFAEADVFLLPARSENMPNAILEAMAAQLPVICTEVGAIREMVSESGACFVPIADAAAIAAAIRRLLGDRGACLSMGQANRERVMKRFSYDCVVRTLEDVYTRYAITPTAVRAESRRQPPPSSNEASGDIMAVPDRMNARSGGEPATWGLVVAKNTATLAALRLLTPALSVALVVAVSRYLGTEGLGRYTLAFTVLYFATTVAPMGLYSIITRDGARTLSGLEGLLGHALTIGTLASLAVTAIVVGATQLISQDAATRSALLMMSLAILPATVGSLLEGAAVALERMEYIALSTLAETLLRVGGGLGVLVLGGGLDGVILMAVAGRVLACLAAIHLLRRAHIRAHFGWEPSALRALGTTAPTFLLIALFATLYWRIDILMLSELRSVADVGYYGAAWRLLEFALIVPQSLCLSLYPRMASLAQSDPDALNALGQTAMRYLFAASLPLAVGATVLAEPVLTLLYGEPFRTAGLTLTILMWTLVPYAWVRYHAYVLVAAELQRIDMLLNVAMSAVNIALNLVLIPAYGSLGAAIATLTSVGVYGLAQYGYLTRKLADYRAPTTAQGGPLAAAAAMGICIWLVRGCGPIVGVALGGCVYLAALVAMGFFTSAELRLLHLDRRFSWGALAAKRE